MAISGQGPINRLNQLFDEITQLKVGSPPADRFDRIAQQIQQEAGKLSGAQRDNALNLLLQVRTAREIDLAASAPAPDPSKQTKLAQTMAQAQAIDRAAARALQKTTRLTGAPSSPEGKVTQALHDAARKKGSKLEALVAGGSSLTNILFDGKTEMAVLQQAQAFERDKGLSDGAVFAILSGLEAKMGALGGEPAFTSFMTQHTDRVSPTAISGLPNRANDCFLNATLQNLAEGLAEGFTADSPVDKERLRTKLTPEDYRSYHEQGVIDSAARSEEHLTTIHAKLEEARLEIGELIGKVNRKAEISEAEVGALREKLHNLGIITASDHRQEDGSSVIERILDKILSVTPRASSFQQEITHTHTIKREDFAGDRVPIDAGEVPGDAIIYRESSAGVYESSRKEVQYTSGQAAASGRDWSPIEHSDTETFDRPQQKYIQDSDGNYYMVAVKKSYSKEGVTRAGAVLQLTIGRDPASPKDVTVPREIAVGGHRYALRAFLSHKGPSASSGHYIANRFAQTPSGHRQWCLCNDSYTYAYGVPGAATDIPPDPRAPGFGGEAYTPHRLLSRQSTSLQYVRID